MYRATPLMQGPTAGLVSHVNRAATARLKSDSN